MPLPPRGAAGSSGHWRRSTPTRDTERSAIRSAAARRVVDVLNAEPELVRSELHRSTQTNEPGRCAVFQSVIALIAQRGHPSINLIDVGTSAGINLYFDRFPVRETDDDDPLTLVCHDETPVDRGLRVPDVVSRVGIDPSPLDLAVEDDRLWLEACLWPEEPRRLERLDAIIERRSSWPETTVLRGTVAERLGDAIALGDPSSLTVVMNSYVAAYFSEGDQRAYFEDMVERCAQGQRRLDLAASHRTWSHWPTSFDRQRKRSKGARRCSSRCPARRRAHGDGVTITDSGWRWTCRTERRRSRGRLGRFGQVVQLDRDSAPSGRDGAKVQAVSMEAVLGDERRHRHGGGVLIGRDDLAASTLEVVQDLAEVLGRERRRHFHDPLQHDRARGLEGRAKAE